MKQNCKRCLFEWDSIVALPRVCPRCKSYYWNTLRKGVNSPEAIVAAQPDPLVIPYSVQMDMDRDIHKLTRTPKDQMADAIVALQAAYDDQSVVQQIVEKAMENKKTFAEQDEM